MLRHVGVTQAPDPGAAGGGRRLADRARHPGRFSARLVHQPDPGIHRQSAVVPLEHAAAHAVGLAGGGGADPAGVRDADRLAGRPAGGGRQRDTRGTGGLVMGLSRHFRRWLAGWLIGAIAHARRAGAGGAAAIRRRAAEPAVGVSARLRRPSRIPHRMVVRHRLAADARTASRSASSSPSSAPPPRPTPPIRAASRRNS